MGLVNCIFLCRKYAERICLFHKYVVRKMSDVNPYSELENKFSLLMRNLILGNAEWPSDHCVLYVAYDAPTGYIHQWNFRYRVVLIKSFLINIC